MVFFMLVSLFLSCFSSSETVLLLISFHKTCKQGRVGNVAKACGPLREKIFKVLNLCLCHNFYLKDIGTCQARED